MMSVSDWISIICAGVALIVTVIIAVLQIRQSNRMERFEKRQDKRDEERHQESVKAQAVSFISKYYKDRGLIPLCAIATMYNDLFSTERCIGNFAVALKRFKIGFWNIVIWIYESVSPIFMKSVWLQ